MAKETVAEVVIRVLRKIQEDAITAADVVTALNICNVDIASRILITDLAAVSEVTFIADQNTIALPDDYHRNLSHGYNKTTSSSVMVRDSRRLIDKNINILDMTGNVLIIAPDNRNLYYQKVPPSNQEGYIYYHRLPDDLTISGNFPDYIQHNFVHSLYFHYASYYLYDNYLEDGKEGEKVNTLYHEDKYEEGIDNLIKFIGPDPDTVTDHKDNIGFSFDGLY